LGELTAASKTGDKGPALNLFPFQNQQDDNPPEHNHDTYPVQDWTIPSTSNLNGKKYEYVIVGSGAGGGPLAARLAMAGHSVLLIEAGDDQTNTLEYQVPALHAVSSEFEKTRWDYYVHHYDNMTQQARDSKLTYSVPNGPDYTGLNPPYGANPKGVLYPRAATVGGCTSHNAIVTIYPNEVDFEHIVDITGDNSWAPDKMREYFKKLERNRYFPLNGDQGHGFTGWLELSLTSLTLIAKDLKLISLVVAAATALGQNLVDGLLQTVTGLGHLLLKDINRPGRERDGSEGLYQVPLAMHVPSYKRAGPADLLKEVIGAKNPDGSRKYKLDFALNTLATKVKLDNSTRTPKATGVEFLQGKSLYSADPRYQPGGAQGVPGTVTATREVILSAGTFNTPQLLMLSGIGPREQLQEHKIPVRVNLPGVGKNLQDRYEVSVMARAPTPISLLNGCTFLGNNDECLKKWQQNPIEKGAYSTNGVAIASLMKSSVAENDTTDLFIAGWPAAFKGYQPKYFEQAVKGHDSWAWVPLKAHTRNNNGSVTLRSSSPFDTPDIRFRYFDIGGDEDLTALVEALKHSRKIFQDLIPLDGKFVEYWPGDRVQTDDDWRQFAMDEAWGHHACCTAPIGRQSDPNAVVDSNFKVFGVQGLRVVDASVFPKIPGYYIAAAIYMISEKAAAAILADAK
jgi:choline dehydrogenase